MIIQNPFNSLTHLFEESAHCFAEACDRLIMHFLPKKQGGTGEESRWITKTYNSVLNFASSFKTRIVASSV
jgi:hypothetical protein